MTVTITRIPASPPKPRTPRPTRREFEITGTLEAIQEYLAEERKEYDPYDPMYGNPIEQPDGSWKVRGSKSYSCD